MTTLRLSSKEQGDQVLHRIRDKNGGSSFWKNPDIPSDAIGVDETLICQGQPMNKRHLLHSDRSCPEESMATNTTPGAEVVTAVLTDGKADQRPWAADGRLMG